MNRSTPGHPVHHQLPILGEFFDAIVNGIILFHFSIFPSINRSSCRFLDIGVYSPALVKVLVHHSCPTLCNPMDCSPPGSSVHGISQARILEWVAIFFSREESILGTVSKPKEDYESENISRSFSLQKFSWFVPGKIWVGLENNLRCGRHFRRRTHEIWDLLDTGEEKKGQ